MSVGTLYLVATPIGNLEDMTYRAVRVLRESDVIACEDTRHSRKLLDHYGIDRPLTSYHEHNETERSADLLERLRRGQNVALISDAGTPLISDPGYRMVHQAAGEGIPVVPVPGRLGDPRRPDRLRAAYRQLLLWRFSATQELTTAEADGAIGAYGCRPGLL